MRQSIDKELLGRMTYLVGGEEIVEGFQHISAREPFDEAVLDFLNEVSRMLMQSKEAKAYPDVITFAFWIRKSSILQLKERFYIKDENIHLGRGVAFHIAPSNVPVNYAYSLVTGLLTGNANVVRIPSKDFPQIEMINRAIRSALENHEDLRPYLCLVRYDREQKINDLLSALADIRIIWGGDTTIEEIRKSPLPPRANEVTFADRFSLAVIDSDFYISCDNKKKIAEDFYNDTYLTDQNACTSPRIVVWMGHEKEKAKEAFWENLHALVKQKYTFQPIQAINKLTSSYLLAAAQPGIEIEKSTDNFVVRVKVPRIDDGLMEFKDNSGYFFEYDCEDIFELEKLCDDNHCQTIGYLGHAETIIPLLSASVRGVDRIVPLGKTMEFDLIWDGYNLFEHLTRIIKVNR